MAVKTVLYYIGTSRIFIKDVLCVAFVGIKFEIRQILAFRKKLKKNITFNQFLVLINPCFNGKAKI
jgi:hypothetical protein